MCDHISLYGVLGAMVFGFGAAIGWRVANALMSLLHRD